MSHTNFSTFVWSVPGLLPGDRRQSDFRKVILTEQDVFSSAAARTRRVDELSTTSERAIALIEERRTSLSSATVTGKIEVRVAS
jgi:hypothetical protein